MIRIALTSAAAHRGRLALTAIAIVLGVAFVSGSFVFTDTINARFETLFEDVYAGVDVTVRPVPAEFGVGPGPTDAALPGELLEEVRATDGVEAAVGSVGGLAQVVDADGQPIGGQGPPTLGLTWIDEPALSALRIDEGNGRPPTAPQEVVVDVATAEANGLEVGDHVDVQTDGGTNRHELVGLASFGTEDNLAGATMAVFTLARGQQLFGLEGQLSAIDVLAADGTAPDELVDRLGSMLPEGIEVVTGDQQVGEQLDAFTEGMGFVTTALLAFAGVAVFVGAFVIHNTFRIVVAQRIRELALLRAIGATARQVVGVVVVEALAVATVASALGVGVGIGVATGIKAIMEAGGVGIPDGPLTVVPRTVAVGMVVGVAVTLVSALVPARKAASVPPVAALAMDGGPTHGRSLRRRALAGTAVALVGSALVGFGLFDSDGQVAVVASGAGVVFLGVTILAPLAAAPLVRLLGSVLPGVTGRLARDNTIRQPRRTAATGGALMVGVALVGFVAVLATSIQESVAATLEGAFPADLAFASTNVTAGVSPQVEARLEALDEFATVSSIRLGEVRIDGVVTGVVAVDGDVGAVYDMDASIDPADIGDGMLVADAVAGARGWSIGDVVDVESAGAGLRPTPIVGTFSDTTFGTVVVAVDLRDATSGGPIYGGGVDPVTGGLVAPEDLSGIALTLGRLTDGVDIAQGQAAAEDVLVDFPSIDMNTRDEQVAQAEEQVQGVMVLFIGLLALAVVIAVLGIANTLSLSIVERIRELGLLRAIGMTRRQVRRMVRGEAVIVALFGTVLGLAAGTSLGWATVAAMADQGLGVFGIPWLQLAGLVLVAVAAGMLAAIGPARSAARMDVLAALATE